MKQSQHSWSIALMAVSLLAHPLAVGNCGADETIRVLCYNIHYGQGTDGVYDVERLAKVIKQSQTDFVAAEKNQTLMQFMVLRL